MSYTSRGKNGIELHTDFGKFNCREDKEHLRIDEIQ